MKIKSFLLLCTCAICVSLPSDAQNAKVKDAFTRLPAGQIHLTNYLENDIENSINHWNKGVLPYDTLCNLYRLDGNTKTIALGEMWAKAVRSGSLFYAYTGDKELKSILQTTVADVLTTVRSNGSISCYPPEKQPNGPHGDLWDRKYVLLGLGEYYKSVSQDPSVMKAIIGEANSVVNQIGPAPKININDQGWSKNRIESSSLLEPMVLTYRLTGDKRYLDFATYIIKSGGCKGADIFQQSIDNVLPRKMADGYPKAYEMVSVFEGLAEYYRVTGEEKWKTSITNFFNNIRKNEITLIGNGGADQPYFPQYRGEAWDNTAIEQANPKIQRMMETCAGVTWMKFCDQVVRLTGSSLPVDEIERYVYNGLLGAMKPGGNGFSYVNLLNGQKNTDSGWGWNFSKLRVTCCNLNGPIGLSFIPRIAIMQAEDGPVVNLYNGMTATTLSKKKQPVKMNVITEFPESNLVKIKVDPRKDEKFTVRLRIPAWSKNTEVKVNGETVGNVVPGTYLCLNRKWSKGDVIDIKLEMVCHLIDAPKSSNPDALNYQALQYGPIVLCRDENTDSDYNKPVKIIADGNGIVNIKSVAPELKTTRMEFLVPTSEGNIHMIDYSSMNGWGSKKICTWLPKK